MNTVQRKADEMVDHYGQDMAISQAAYHARTARGVVRKWWEEVLRSLERNVSEPVLMQESHPA